MLVIRYSVDGDYQLAGDTNHDTDLICETNLHGTEACRGLADPKWEPLAFFVVRRSGISEPAPA